VSALPAGDIRRAMPRFKPEHYPANLALLKGYTALASEMGCTPAQLALAWLLHKAPHIIPIPGTTNESHMRDNIAAARIALSPQVLAQVDGLINQQTVSGPRYDAQATSEVDTENFA
jgi:aryl-alcohol dehydrogenase-like predicted oxidoreductase